MTAADEVALRDKSTAPQMLVTVTWLSLERLYKITAGDGPDALNAYLTLYELHAACTDPAHKVFGDFGQRLQDLGLACGVQADGTVTVHEIVRHIVLSALDVSEDGQTIHLVSPYAG
jgi:hypothetical protein